MCRAAFFLLLCALLPAPVLAQGSITQQLQESRKRLDDIKAERERLRAEQDALQGQAHDLDAELSILERQREQTNRIVNEIETQIGGLNDQVDQVSASLVLAQDNLAEKRAVLQRRLVEIYQRGPLYDFQALLAAESFGDLLTRYKYLYLTSRQDKALVADVERLRNRVVRQRDDILNVRNELGLRRDEREVELQRYGKLAEERASRLRAVKRSARYTERRLTDLERNEAQLNDLLAALEKARREELARAGRSPMAAAPGTISTSDIGKLDWPVEGQLLYRFGRDTLPSGAVIRWNGVGIQAPVGTPVKAVEAGRVAVVQKLGTYGLTIVLAHGNGYYSVYSYLESAQADQGATVAKGQIIGTVGGANSDQGAHLHFEIRGENQIALDPADWLRKRR